MPYSSLGITQIKSITRYAMTTKHSSQFIQLDFSFESQREEGYLRVVGSCNGLICLSDDLAWCGYTIIFWNPLIRKSITLPTPNITFSTHGPYYPFLGFGYDSRTDYYKLVRLVYLQGLGDFAAPPEVELYSLRKGTWKTISAGAPNYNVRERVHTHVFTNGASHWVAFRRTNDDLFTVVLLAFDICDEVFREMMVPKSLAGQGSWGMSISEFGESISVINYDKNRHKCCDVWVMKEYNVVESWTKQYTFNLLYTNDLKCIDDDDDDAYGYAVASWVLGFRKDGEVLLRISCCRKLALFNPGSKQVEDIGIHGLGCCIKSYVESLVLFDKPN